MQSTPVEMGSSADIPEYPIIFTKPPTSIVGMNEAVEADEEVTRELDYEGEIAVIIGKKGKKIPENEALNHVFGFTLLNDITARDIQARHKQFFLGKSMDTFCPLGPFVLLNKDWETFSPILRTYVNGGLRQESSMNKMIFSVKNLISTLSAGMTLYPGDIIATGTPSGVGKGFKPPRFLKTRG
nr:fumarylacetoacetate hydrolase family protein [Sinobaca sp. H24]